jgi:putative ABC transport system permease protein
MDTLLQDLRYAVSQLRAGPGFTLVAVATLALGIGANTAMFSVTHEVLLRPLPYEEPDRIVTLWEKHGEDASWAVSEPNFSDWQRLSRSFEAMALHSNYGFGGPPTILGAETAVRGWTAAVSTDFFSVFGVQATRGRLFAADEHRQGGPPVAVVSHSFWRNHLGADPDALGRTLTLWREAFEIVGILPPSFRYPGETDIWIPLERFGANSWRTAHNWAAVGRLRNGVTVETAQVEMDRIGASLRQQFGEESDASGAQVTRLQDELVGDLRRPLFLLLGAAALVLLVGCANLASTLLARSAGREREIAIRAALGAGRLRLVRQLLTESFLLSLLGAGAGVGLAAWTLHGLLALAPASVAGNAAVGLNARVLGFTLVVSVIATLLFGLLPALRGSERGFATVLPFGAWGSTGRTRRGLWGLLLGSEVALALLLLIASGLLIRSFQEVMRIEPGLDPSHVLTIDVAPPESKYAGDVAKASYYERLLAELERVLGVEAAGLIQHVPLGGVSWNSTFEIEGQGKNSGWGHYRIVGGDYFRTMGIPLLRGRVFDARDRAAATPVAIINETLAKREWPDEDPLGKRFRDIGNEPLQYRDAWLTVVGVVADVRHGGLLREASPEIYVHVLQRPHRALEAVVALRTGGPPTSVIGAARARIRELDRDVPVEFSTMSARVLESVADRRFTMLVLTVFAAVTLVLAAVGIYGVVSQAVASRYREIGIRIALGADPRRVRGLVVRNSMRVVLAGIMAGGVASLGATRILRHLLFGVSTHDPGAYVMGGIVLTVVALLASYLPARRATRVDPMVALRAE